MALDERNELDEAPESKDALATTAFGSETPSDRVAVQALAPVETGPSGLAADSVGGFAGAARSEPRRIVLDDDEDEGPDPMIGQVLSGLYKVHSRIGRGGMGTVYMAVHIHLDKPFAVKVLSDQIAANKSAVQRLLQEARTASSIDHDNIVDVFSFDAMEDGRVFLVMELLEGVSLSELVERGPMRLERALPIARQVCQALEAAHGRGVVHRDLKPENVFICRKREADFVKVLDFGISKVRAADAEAVRVTKTGQLVGTPLYMSPEQARGELDVDHRADVYALGVMLFEMVTGRPPFEGTNYFQLLWKHGNEPAPSARTKMPELPEALDAVLLRSLEKKPEARFQSMREMEEALIAVAPELGDPDRLVSLPPRPSSATPAAVVPPPAPPRRPAWVAWAAVAAAIALLGGGFAVARLTAPTTETEAPVTAAAPPAPHEAPSKALTEAHPHEATEPVPGPTVDPVPEGVLPPSPVVVRIESTPPGAVVRLGDEEQGRTPLSLPLPPGAPVDLQLRLSGYAPESLTVVPTEGLTERVRLTPRPRTPSRSDDLPIRMSL